MRRAAAFFLAAAMGLLLLPACRAEIPWIEAPQGERRALLVGCDHFVTQKGTWPAAEHNVEILGDALEEDVRQYALIRRCPGDVTTAEALSRAIAETFSDARDADTSLLYIATHGIFDGRGSNGGAALILSDGETEELLFAEQLQQMLDAVPGRKVLILDACNSGAFIGKGLSGGADRVSFTGPDYKVLCSAGGSEASWYFQGNQEPTTAGASYFATVLTGGLGGGSDQNGDGLVTMDEIYGYLMDNYAASTPQIYPQSDGDFVLYAYAGTRDREREKAVTDLAFDDTVLIAGQSRVSFSFTVRREVALYYQVVYHENGLWRFEEAQQYQDAETENGTVLPGRKARNILLHTDEDAFGYAMIQLITLEAGQPVFQGARLLCVQPREGDVQLNAAVDPAFIPGIGQEACILAQHSVPCALSVSIVDSRGDLVRRLAYDMPSRPQQLQPNASSFYWDGRTQRGGMAPAGLYTAVIRVRIGDRTFMCESAPIELIGVAPAEALEAAETPAPSGAPATTPSAAPSIAPTAAPADEPPVISAAEKPRPLQERILKWLFQKMKIICNNL